MQKNCRKIAAKVKRPKTSTMATITFELGKPKQDKTRKVAIILSHKGQRKRIPTSIVLAEVDMSRSGKITSRKIKKAIDDKIKILNDALYDLEIDLMDKDVSVDWIYNRLTKRETKDIDFFSFTEEWVEKSTNKGKKNYLIMLNSLERFNGCRELPFALIDYNFLNEYKRFLDGHPRAQSLYLGNIRHIINEAIKEHNIGNNRIIESNPFEKFTIPKDVPQTKDRVISIENLIKVFNFKGTRRVGMARDCYIMSFCLIGMNSVDLYECTSYKNGILAYDRAKTKDKRSDNAHIEIEVPDVIKPLFKKYKGTSRVFDFYQRYSNSGSFNKHINKGLHTIAETLGIPKFDFYSARHTWASIARNKLGIDKYTIHEALNHKSNLDVTDIYIQKDYTNINKANTMVVNFILELVEQKKKEDV